MPITHSPRSQIEQTTLSESINLIEIWCSCSTSLHFILFTLFFPHIFLSYRYNFIVVVAASLQIKLCVTVHFSIFFSFVKSMKKRVKNNRHHNRCAFLLFALCLANEEQLATIYTCFVLSFYRVENHCIRRMDVLFFSSYAWWMYVRRQNVITRNVFMTLPAQMMKIEFLCLAHGMCVYACILIEYFME